jgi:MinD-like ATPase involved in chromosome partitioning or flagellar assembly
MGAVVAIHSFRGGTGKSNLTANLAYCCAITGVRVGVVDTDIQSPGIHVLFGLGGSPMKYCLNDYLKGECSISEPVYDVSDRLGLASGTINLIPSRLNAQAIVAMLKEGFDVQRLSTALSDLTRELRLDILLVDTHPGIEEDTLLSIAMCDTLVVILRPDEQDYLGTAVTFEIAKRMEVPRTFLIANRVPPDLDLKQFKTKLEETYKVPIIGVLPFSYGLMMAQSKQVYCFSSPSDPFSVAVKTAAEKILQSSR